MVALPSLKNKPRIFNFMPVTKEGEFKGYKSVPGLHCNFLFKNLSAKSLESGKCLTKKISFVISQ